MRQMLGLGVIAVAALFVYACGINADIAALSTKHSATYTGAGSVWNWQLTAAGAFTATKKATSASSTEEMHLEGTYETFATGFYKFTLTTVTGTSSTLPTVGDTAVGFAVPSVLLIVKLSTAGSETLVMPVLSGACPTYPVSFNWVQASLGGQPAGKMWGNGTIASATSVFTGKQWTVDGAPEALDHPPTFTGCTDGKLTFSDGFVSMTSGGVGIMNVETGPGDIIAFPRDNTVTDMTLRNRTYVGLVFNELNHETFPLNFTLLTSGDGTYSTLSDVTTGEVADSGALGIAAVGTGDQVGFVRLVANASGAHVDPNPPTMWAAVGTMSGHTAFFAAGFRRNTDGSAIPGNNFSLIAVDK